MAWNLTEITEELFKGIPAAMTECFVTNDGIRIIIIGRDFNGFQTLFIYEHNDIKIRFHARRVDQQWVNYDPSRKSYANFALGPVSKVWLDTRHMPRQLTSEELETIKSNISEFLISEFYRSKFAIAPNAQTVTEYY